MFYSNDRDQLRQFYFDTWQKHLSGQSLIDLEQQILAVILDHPEYQKILSDKVAALTKDFSVQINQPNPFMHMGLHLAVRDQINLDQPPGIKKLFQEQLAKGKDGHDIEHQIMEILANQLWQDTQAQKPLNMDVYLDNLKKNLINL